MINLNQQPLVSQGGWVVNEILHGETGRRMTDRAGIAAKRISARRTARLRAVISSQQL